MPQLILEQLVTFGREVDGKERRATMCSCSVNTLCVLAIIYYIFPLFLKEHKAGDFVSFQLMFWAAISTAVCLLQVCAGRPGLRLPSGFISPNLLRCLP